MGSIKVTSTAFGEGAMIPKKYTCDDQNVSPQIAWTGVPAGTKSIALICDDPDAPVGDWVHWVVYNMPAATKELAEGVRTLPAGSKQGTNDFRKLDYGGPCPPSGVHRYYFKIYALDTPLSLGEGATKAQLLKAMEGHILDQGALMGSTNASRSVLRPHGGKEEDVADRCLPGEEHDQPVDADAEAAGGRHARLDGLDEVLVHGRRFLVDLAAQGLLVQGLPLEHRVVRFAVGVGDLRAVDEELEALEKALVVVVGLAQRRGLDRVVRDEHRLDQLVLHQELEELVDRQSPDEVALDMAAVLFQLRPRALRRSWP